MTDPDVLPQVQANGSKFSWRWLAVISVIVFVLVLIVRQALVPPPPIPRVTIDMTNPLRMSDIDWPPGFEFTPLTFSPEIVPLLVRESIQVKPL
jgi:hypothetical protein